MDNNQSSENPAHNEVLKLQSQIREMQGNYDFGAEVLRRIVLPHTLELCDPYELPTDALVRLFKEKQQLQKENAALAMSKPKRPNQNMRRKNRMSYIESDHAPQKRVMDGIQKELNIFFSEYQTRCSIQRDLEKQLTAAQEEIAGLKVAANILESGFKATEEERDELKTKLAEVEETSRERQDAHINDVKFFRAEIDQLRKQIKGEQ